MGPQEETLVQKKDKTIPVLGHRIILHNDDWNTFEHVEKCLMDYCGHSLEQATQCAFIVHYKGKCDVKSGSKEDLTPIYRTLLECKLTVTIE